MYQVVLIFHIVNVVLMAAPYYNLVVVSERSKFGPAHVQVDRYFEQIVRGILFRCYFIQWSVLLLGLLLVGLHNNWSFQSLLTQWQLLIKEAAWVAIMVVHNLVYFGIQPRIEALLRGLQGESIPPEITSRVTTLRIRRKQGAAACFFFVLVAVIMGVQISRPLGPGTTVALTLLALLFAWRAYRSGVQYGWV
ncbi:MAG: hypothetical protein HYY96_15805 [Candidatus Tectomicrobia bacterium]|nr:hypothetical protein [Candidatus Tectomicrobia bacterium]